MLTLNPNQNIVTHVIHVFEYLIHLYKAGLALTWVKL